MQHIKTCNLEVNHSRFASKVIAYSCRSDAFRRNSLQPLYVVRKFQLFILICLLWQEQRERRFLPVRLINRYFRVPNNRPPLPLPPPLVIFENFWNPPILF